MVLFEELVQLLEKRALLEVVCHWVWGLYSLTPFPVCFLGFLVIRYNQLSTSSASLLPCFPHLMDHPSGNISQTATCHLYFTLGHQRNWQVMCISHLCKCVCKCVIFKIHLKIILVGIVCIRLFEIVFLISPSLDIEKQLTFLIFYLLSSHTQNFLFWLFVFIKSHGFINMDIQPHVDLEKC